MKKFLIHWCINDDIKNNWNSNAPPCTNYEAPIYFLGTYPIILICYILMVKVVDHHLIGRGYIMTLMNPGLLLASLEWSMLLFLLL